MWLEAAGSTPICWHMPVAGTLQDANLYALDRMLGLDWGNYVLFVDAHPALSGALSMRTR